MTLVKKIIMAAMVTFISTSAIATNIIVVSHGQANDPFWSVVKNGVNKAAQDTGVKVDYRAPETFDMVAMAQMIEAAINQEPDGLVVSLPDINALAPVIKKAVAAGIPIISINSGGDISKDLGALLHVGQSEYDAGFVAGSKLAEMGGKKAICVNQEVGNVSLDLRCEGFKKGFGNTVTVLPTSNDPSEIKSKVAAALASDESIDTVIALAAAIAGEPSVEASIKAGRNVLVASFDLSATFLKMVSEGKAVFAIDQQQFLQGYLPVTFLALHAKYGLIPGGNVPSGPNLITADKASQVIALSAQGIR